MLTITVAQDGSGNFASIGEAVMAVPYDTPARILIGPGTYREKLVCEKQQITLKGAGMEQTRLVWNDGGKLPHRDGRPTHTFRSWTAFFSGDDLTVEDMTIQNDAGPGAQVGQAIAAYVDSRRAAFRHVRLLGNQDTLFCAPLPEKEREKDGFLGPRVFAPRRPSAQYYQGCVIEGDIDFIFGGGDALFEQCVVRSVDNGPGREGRGYVTAPSTPPDGLGFVFWGLRLCVGLSRRLGVSGPALASHRQDRGTGVPAGPAHCAGGLLPLEQPLGLGQSLLCRGGQHRPRRQRAAGGPCKDAVRPGGGRSADPGPQTVPPRMKETGIGKEGTGRCSVCRIGSNGW